MEYDIFISYSRRDTAIVNQFADKFSKAGYKYWMDVDGVESGDEFKRKIVSAIKESKVFLFFSSEASNSSSWTVKEVNVAVMLKKPIIPIKLDNAVYDDSLLFDLAGLDFIECSSDDKVSSGIQKLMRSLKNKIGPGNNGGSEDEPDVKEAERKRKAEEATTLEAYLKGVMAYDKKDYAKAVKWYRKAAEQGDAVAQFNLCYCYYNGLGVPQSYSDAVKWCRKAAEQGNAAAQCNLGYCYYKGTGVPQSYSDAVKWYRKAAEQGNAYAQFWLGNCYYNGQGVPESYSEAVKWYRKAAEQGHQKAKAALERLGQ